MITSTSGSIILYLIAKYLIDLSGFGRNLANLDYVFQGWSQINEHCLSSNVERQKSLEIPFQQCGNECDKHDHTKDLYFGFNRTIQPNKFAGDDVRRNVPVTNGQLESWLNSRSCKHGSPLLEVTERSICQ